MINEKKLNGDNVISEGENKESKELLYEIEELREPIEKILLGLKERIDRGEYGLIVGEDVSGRIPTRIFEWVLRELYQIKGARKPPQVRFFAGSTNNSERQKENKKNLMIEVFNERKARNLILRRALVVTDTIMTGRSLKPICDALTIAGIPFDIASIGLLPTEPGSDIGKSAKEKELGGHIFYGTKYTPSIYHDKSLQGVQKHSGDLYSEYNGSFTEDDGTNKMTMAREDAKILASELVQWYNQQESKKQKAATT